MSLVAYLIYLWPSAQTQRERLPKANDRARGVMKPEKEVLEKMRILPQRRQMPLGKQSAENNQQGQSQVKNKTHAGGGILSKSTPTSPKQGE